MGPTQTGQSISCGPHLNENKQNFHIFAIFWSTQKIAWEGPKWGREVLFPANPDLANILGDTDFDFENLHFWDFLGPKFLAWAQIGPGLGPAWARLGPSLGPAWAQLGPRLGPSGGPGGPLGLPEMDPK